MHRLQSLMADVMCNGWDRTTRSGEVRSVFHRTFKHDMRSSFPAVTCKPLAWKAMVGELLWFLNGETDIDSLRHRSNIAEGKWTIWSNDKTRWHETGDRGVPEESLGKLYGEQWRSFGTDNVDQIANLIKTMKEDPSSRYMIVQAFDPQVVSRGEAALPPCHTGFQVYVDINTGEFDLDWTQRSVDVFLGLPFNIASYATLMLIISELTGLTPRYLIGSLKDTHIYHAHMDQVEEYTKRIPIPSSLKITMPAINSLDDLKGLTAEDFKIENYESHPKLSAPLLVG